MKRNDNPWITNHQLRRVRLLVELPSGPEPGAVMAYMWGESDTQRGRLWHEAGQWLEGQDDTRHAPADWIHHMALTCIQDRPNTSERLLFGLTGGMGLQDPLF